MPFVASGFSRCVVGRYAHIVFSLKLMADKSLSMIFFLNLKPGFNAGLFFVLNMYCVAE